MALTKEEINRKLLHILSGSLIPLAILYLPKINGVPAWAPMAILGVLTALFGLSEFIRLNVPAVQKMYFGLLGSMLRPDEKKKVTGATWIFASAFICTVVFNGSPHISFMAISLFILGDAVAALVGLSMGRVKIGRKSLEGSLACFVLCMVLFEAVFPFVPGLLVPWNGVIPPAVALLGALGITVLELFPIRISRTMILNDNLYVPVIAGCIMMAVAAMV
jgi:dolichol kinase